MIYYCIVKIECFENDIFLILGVDFMPKEITIVVPAHHQRYEFTVDNTAMLHEDERIEEAESFALIAEVSENMACFHTLNGDELCHGSTGATEIVIIDNNSKFCAKICLIFASDACTLQCSLVYTYT